MELGLWVVFLWFTWSQEFPLTTVIGSCGPKGMAELQFSVWERAPLFFCWGEESLELPETLTEKELAYKWSEHKGKQSWWMEKRNQDWMTLLDILDRVNPESMALQFHEQYIPFFFFLNYFKPASVGVSDTRKPQLWCYIPQVPSFTNESMETQCRKVASKVTQRGSSEGQVSWCPQSLSICLSFGPLFSGRLYYLCRDKSWAYGCSWSKSVITVKTLAQLLTPGWW